MTVAISIDGSTLRIANASGKKIDKWYSIGFDTKLVREGIISNPEAMAEVMKQALDEGKLSPKNVRCAITSIGSTSQILTMPSSGKSSLEVAVQREARRVMSISPESSHLHWQQLPASGGKQQVYAVAIPKEPLQALLQTCQIAGIRVASIDLKAMALSRAVNQKDAIIAHGEANSIEMVIMLDSVPVLMRGIWLREHSTDTSKVTALLLQQLASTIEYYNDMNRSHPLAIDVPIYLTGEVALDPELAQRVSALSSRRVAAVEPPVNYPPDFPVSLYVTNIGLILKSS